MKRAEDRHNNGPNKGAFVLLISKPVAGGVSVDEMGDGLG